MSTIKPRFTITVTEDMLEEIDNFRFENRFPTRTQAVNELFRIGLEAVKKKMRDETEKNGKAKDK